MTFFSIPLLSNFVFISTTIALHSSQECRAIVALLHSHLRKNHFQAFRNAAEISGLKKNNVLFSVIIYYSNILFSINVRHAEQVYNVKIQAGETPLEMEGESTGTRAIFVEEDSQKGDNYYNWEAGDKLVVFAGKKKLGELTIKAEDAGKPLARFEGQLKATPDEIASPLKFVYLGKNAIVTGTESESSVSIDLSQQGGKREDISRNSILWGEGKLRAESEGSSTYVTAGPNVTLNNPMSIFHLKVHPPKDGAGNVTKLKLGGKGVYSSVNIDLTTGESKGDERTAGFKWEAPNDRKSGNTFDFYYVLAPGEFTPEFYIYDDKNTSNVGEWLGKEPGITHYTSQQALIRNEKGEISNFTASDPNALPNGKRTEEVYQFTNGNLQYVLGTRVGYMGGVKLTAKRNMLSRYNHEVGSAIQVPTNYKVDVPGEYRLAGWQGETVKPKAVQYHPLQKVGDYYYYMGRGYDSVIDLFGWSNVKHPDLAAKVGDWYSGLIGKNDYDHSYRDYKGDTRTDYGTKVYVDGQPTTMPSVNELVCILFERRFEDDKKYVMSTRAWIDLNGNGVLDNAADIGGIVVFPDGMRKEDANKCWETKAEYEQESTGGSLVYGLWGSTTSITDNRLNKEAIAKYGLLFLPATGAANMKVNKKGEFYMDASWTHANYLCSDWQETAPSRYCKNGENPKQGSTSYVTSGTVYPNSTKYTHTSNGWTDLNGWLGIRLAVKKQ